MLAYPGREKNGNKTIIWDSNDTTIQFVRALQQASCGLHKKHHLHDRLNNHKTRFKVVCTIFCSLNVTSFHTTILRLCRPHLSFRGKNDKKGCLKYSIHCYFPTYFRDSSAGNRRSRIPAVSRIKLKVTEHAQTNYLFVSDEG